MIKKVIPKVFFIAGLLLLADGIFLAISTNLNAGTALVLIAGAALVSGAIWHENIAAATAKGFPRILKYTVLAGVVLLICLVAFLAYEGNRDSVQYDEDAVIVLGAAVHGDQVSLSLARRLDKAIEYADQNPRAVIVVSGGRGAQEEITEASAMKQYLIERGIPEEKIIKEEKSISTYENFKFSRIILDRYFKGTYNCVYITSRYHSYRAANIAKTAGIAAAGLGSGSEWYYLPAAYLRESLAVIKYWVFTSVSRNIAVDIPIVADAGKG